MTLASIAVEDQPQSTPTQASPAGAQSLAARVTELAASDSAQPPPPDYMADGEEKSEAAWQLAMAAAKDRLIEDASTPQQQPDPEQDLTADSGSVDPPSSTPDRDFTPDELAEAVAYDLAGAAEVELIAAGLAATGEIPSDPSSSSQAALQDFVRDQKADSGAVDALSSVPDDAGTMLDAGLSDVAAEALVAAAEEAAYLVGDDSLLSGSKTKNAAALQGDAGSDITDNATMSAPGSMPESRRLQEDDMSNAAAEDLTAAAEAAQPSASSTELHSDATSQLGAPERRGTSMGGPSSDSAELSSSSIAPPPELRTGVASDLSELHLLRSQVCNLAAVGFKHQILQPGNRAFKVNQCQMHQSLGSCDTGSRSLCNLVWSGFCTGLLAASLSRTRLSDE